MDIFLTILGFLFMLIGLIGSFLTCASWTTYKLDWIIATIFNQSSTQRTGIFRHYLAVALIVFALDYIIPALGTKKFGGSKTGMIGTTVGLLVAIFFQYLEFLVLLSGLLLVL